MDLGITLNLAQTISFVAFLLIGIWYVAPWMAAHPLGQALVPMIWVHAFRNVALQLFSAVELQGAQFPTDARDQIAYGDLVGVLLALTALLTIRYAPTFAKPVVWLLVVVSVVDLGNALVVGIIEDLLQEAFGVSWLILAFYVPALWVSLGLIVWQLYSRRSEDI